MAANEKLLNDNLKKVWSILNLAYGSEKSEPETADPPLHMRVCIGYNEAGNAIVKQVHAYDELSLADKIVEAVVASGRINEFLQGTAKVVNFAPPATEHITPSKTNFAAYCQHWLITYKQGVSINTGKFYKIKVGVLNQAFGEKNVDDIRPADIQKFLDERSAQYKRATVKADFGVLKEVLDSAVDDGIIPKNPAKDRRVHNPAIAGSGTTALTKEQIASIQKSIPGLKNPTERCMIALLAYSSMRREEMLGLTWENIDFENRCFKIEQAVVFINSRAIVKETKNKYSVRTFPMNDTLYEILWSCRQEHGFIITPDPARPINDHEYRKLWDSLSSHIELYGMTAINFRTTFCTMAVASGVDIKTTQALMGHADPSMTLKVYAKEEKSHLPDAMEKMREFIG